MADKDEVPIASGQDMTLDAIMELGKTDPKAADRELVRQRDKREALESAKFFRDHPEDVQVTGHLDEMNVSTQDKPIEIIKRQKAETDISRRSASTEIDISEAGSRRALVRAKRIEIDGGVAISPDDPLATEKRKVANKLKKVGRTLNNLPPDWDQLPEVVPVSGTVWRQGQDGFWV